VHLLQAQVPLSEWDGLIGRRSSPATYKVLNLTYLVQVGISLYGGALLAELSMIRVIVNYSANRGFLYQILPFSLVFLGWYVISYPKLNPEWQVWSNSLTHVGSVIFPDGANIYAFWGVTGTLLMTTGITLSWTLQRILSHPILLWLGVQSFPIYLIHGSLVRSFLNWMLYAGTTPDINTVTDRDGAITQQFPRYNTAPGWRFIIALPIFSAVLLALANVWTSTIERQCASITSWLERTICDKHEEQLYTAIELQEEIPMSGQPKVTFNGAGTSSLLPK
jgi:uncharacterized membrane protein YccF (DUF307 family)